MTSKINADTSDGLKITSDTSGTLDIQSGGTTKMTVGSTIDLQGNELVLDADGDSSIHSSVDDQIDFKIGGTDVAKLTDGQVTLTSATASRPGIVLESTNEDANPPFLRFQKNGASPADNDEVGLIAFYADDDAGNVFIPAQIKVTTDDVSDGTEDGFIKFFTTVNGTLSEKMRITEDDVLIGSTSTNESERLHVAHTGGGVVSLMRTPNSGNTSIIIFRNLD